MKPKLFRTFIDWLFPPVCAGCGKEGEVFCPECLATLRLIKQPNCRYCGASLDKAGICAYCSERMPPYKEVFTYAAYSGSLREGILSMKYQKNFWLGEVFSQLLIQALETKKWPIDIVMPIPLGEEKLEERGYNQAALLSAPIAKHFGWIHDQRSLMRIKEIRSQVALSREQRFENVRFAFLAEHAKKSGQTVLLVDDVFTTGATLSDAARALRSAGYDEIYAITLAKAAIRKSDN